VCGADIAVPDDMNPLIPVGAPIEALQFMTHSDMVEAPVDTESLSLRFCEEHWVSVTELIGNPQAVSFGSFDARFVDFDIEDSDTVSGSSIGSHQRSQDRLRVARERMKGVAEFDVGDEDHRKRRRLSDTLLVAAVDYYNIDYGPIEVAKDKLVEDLREQDYQATRVRDSFIDIQISTSGMDGEVVGTVFVVTEDSGRIEKGPLSKWERDPEHYAGNTVYYWMGKQNFTEAAAEEYPDARYVGFYWLPHRETWRWFPFPSDFDTSFGTDDRTYLPIEGPGKILPTPPIGEISDETLNPADFEKVVDDRWESITENQSYTERMRDELRRRLEQHLQ